MAGSYASTEVQGWCGACGTVIRNDDTTVTTSHNVIVHSGCA
jgi:hypothetical protein